MTAVAIPRYELAHRFKLSRTGVVYRCDACNGPVFLRCEVRLSNPVELLPPFEMVLGALEPFEDKYLQEEVRSDLLEARTCYAHSCWNAFAAMCRRCLQSVATSQGVQGTTKVEAQLKELKEMGVADDETFDVLREIMLGGHDGAHPHLPSLDLVRAAILMQLLKDVLYQLYVRPGKVREASELRKQAART